MRISKQKPQYSYTSGNTPDLPFLKNSQTEEDPLYSIDNDPFFSLDDDLPSPSTFIRMKQSSRETVDPSSELHPARDLISSMADDSVRNIEAVMLDVDEPMVGRNSSKLKVDASFENRIFNFEAFDNGPQNEDGLQNKETEDEISTSSCMRYACARSQSPRQNLWREQPVSPSLQSQKRLSSLSPDRVDVKHQRVSTKQRADRKEAAKDESFNLAVPDEPDRQRRPAWVDEMDPEIIQSLLGIVDFVE